MVTIQVQATTVQSKELDGKIHARKFVDFGGMWTPEESHIVRYSLNLDEKKFGKTFHEENGRLVSEKGSLELGHGAFALAHDESEHIGKKRVPVRFTDRNGNVSTHKLTFTELSEFTQPRIDRKARDAESARKYEAWRAENAFWIKQVLNELES